MLPALPRTVALSLLLLPAAASTGCAATPIAPAPIAIDVAPPAPPALAIAPAAPAPEPVALRDALDAPGAVAFVEIADDAGWIVLGDAGDEEVAGGPALRTDPASGFTALEAEVNVAVLDRELQVEGRRFDLYEGDTRLCTVTAGPLLVLGVTATPFDVLEDPMRRSPPDASDYFAYARRFVAAPVDVPAACRRATWARLAELPAPRFASAREVAQGGRSTERAAQLRSSPAWREVQQRFDGARAAGSTAHTGTWDEAGAVTETTWTASFTGARWTTLQAVWDEGCGAAGSLTLAWRETADGAALLHAAEDRFDVEAVVDLDGDGTLEMIGTSWGARELRRFFGAGSEPIRSYEVPEHGCPC